MDYTILDKIMKSYWEYKFSHIKLDYFYIYSDIWYGFSLQNSTMSIGEKTMVACPANQLEYNNWYYSESYFKGGKELFNLNTNEVLFAMRRYLNKTYNLHIKTIV